MDDCDAYHLAEAFRDAREGGLIDAAMRDILAGHFDSDTVHEALRLGHHEDYPKLKDTRDAAMRAARAAGGPS